MSVHLTPMNPVPSAISAAGAAGAINNKQLCERISGTFWKCVAVIPLGDNGDKYVFELNEAYNTTSCSPEEFKRKVQAIDEATKRIFPAEEINPGGLQKQIYFPTTFAEIASVMWEQMLSIYSHEVQEKHMNADETLKKMLNDVLPDRGNVDNFISEMLQQLGVKSLSEDPDILKRKSDLCKQILADNLKGTHIFDNFFKRNKINNQIIKDLGISLEYRDGKWILTLPSREALLYLWELQREKNKELPALDICESSGKADDLEFIKVNSNGQIVLSADKEFVHDFQLHVLMRIILILKYTWARNVSINDYLQRYRSFASTFMNIIKKSEAYIGDDQVSLLTLDEHKALTTLLAAIIDSIAANKDLDPHIYENTSVVEMAREQITMAEWSTFLRSEFTSLTVRGPSEDKLENLVTKLGEVMAKLEIEAEHQLPGVRA